MSAERSHSDERRMARADEYRALARQCLQWAREATTNDVCKAYLDLERQWLEAASNLDDFPLLGFKPPSSIGDWLEP